ncbi:MAG: hypothetical protein KC495_02320 [Dehalococcoidia bacterium]|nr:hypothetical protein [Dehalococcoidia bacterium]
MGSGFSAERDDRVLPITRTVAALLVPVLALAFVVLFFEARDTGDHFAWTIRPPMTPVVMASGYLGGAYYFARMASGTRWHQTGVVLPAVSVFATVMMLATIIHWDKFNHGHIAFWLWVILYIVAPPLVFGLWLVNRSRDPHLTDEGDPVTPGAGRMALLAVAGVTLVIAIGLFLRPVAWSGWWPWALSPLTARVMSGWFALAGTASILLARDRRASSWTIPLEATIVWAAFLGLGALRYRSAFDGSVERVLFLVVIGVWLAGFLVLRFRTLAGGASR